MNLDDHIDYFTDYSWKLRRVLKNDTKLSTDHRIRIGYERERILKHIEILKEIKNIVENG